MQWPLAFRSTVSRGSIFKVTVPLTAPASESATPIPVQFPAASASKVAVVVVDDDPLVRDAMKRLISSWGLHVEACSNGDQAMEILRSRDGAFRWEALIDFRLSDTEDGLAIANRIHEFFGRNVGTALMTAETDDAIFKQAGRKSIVVLRKPIKPIRLRAILMRSSIEQLEGRAGEASRRTSN
jgi:CheY-like chemotaxis protein